MSISIGIISTYPPTQCGLATYSASLAGAFLAAGDRVSVVSVVDRKQPSQPPEVAYQWIRGHEASTRVAASVLNRQQLVILEHEFGIFGGADGVEVLDILRHLHAPVVTMMHTVLSEPTAHQAYIIDALLRGSATVIVMTQAARMRLIERYGADPDSIVVIPHGAQDPRRFSSGVASMFRTRPAIITWGLLGPGKGIEWAIEAMGMLKGLKPAPLYKIVGETHPKIAQRDGEQYREHLQGLVDKCGVGGNVMFDGRYLESAELFRMAAQTDVALLPYDSKEQVTSGVLVEAVALGKPVISTTFPHAVELLSSGAGILVNRRDPAAIAEAIHVLVTQPRVAAEMAAEARRLTPDLLWSAVADQHRALTARNSMVPGQVGRIA